MVIRVYCIEIVSKFYFRHIFVYRIGIRIISKIFPGFWIIQTPPDRASLMAFGGQKKCLCAW